MIGIHERLIVSTVLAEMAEALMTRDDLALVAAADRVDIYAAERGVAPGPARLMVVGALREAVARAKRDDRPEVATCPLCCPQATMRADEVEHHLLFMHAQLAQVSR